MVRSGKRRWIVGLAAIALAGSMTPARASASGGGLYVPPPNHGAKRQIASYSEDGDKASAALIRADDRHPPGGVVHGWHADSR